MSPAPRSLSPAPPRPRLTRRSLPLRNVTCYWSLRQKDIPTCKHAMISVRQEYSHKMQIKRSISMAR